MPEWLVTFVGLEQAATIIRCHEAQFVPGLLQTEDYAHTVIDLGQAGDADEVEQRVALRMQRHQLLDAPKAPEFWAVIDEAVLRRNIGGRAVMSEQLDHLLKVSERPNITVQVVPFDRSDAAATGGPFTLLRFDDPDMPDIVFVEQLTSALYLDKRRRRGGLPQDRRPAGRGSVDPRRSAALIASVRDQLCARPDGRWLGVPRLTLSGLEVT